MKYISEGHFLGQPMEPTGSPVYGCQQVGFRVQGVGVALRRPLQCFSLRVV